MPLTSFGALAVLPFLPSGRGALILIFGGLLVLPFSLILSRSARPTSNTQGETPARRPAARPGVAPSPARVAVAAGPPSPWTGTGTATAPMNPQWTPVAASAPANPQWTPVAASAPVNPQWNGTGLERALRLAVGGTQLVAAAPGHYIVRLNHCASCARKVAGCGAERAAIQRAVAAYMPFPHVTERACAQRERDACTFEIRRG